VELNYDFSTVYFLEKLHKICKVLRSNERQKKHAGELNQNRPILIH